MGVGCGDVGGGGRREGEEEEDKREGTGGKLMHLIRVAGRLGASSRRPRHHFPALMAGVNPGRVPVYTVLKRRLMSTP